jgi:hypothetical protein
LQPLEIARNGQSFVWKSSVLCSNSKENSRARPIFLGMAEPHVISALRAKRAELSGDLIAAQKQLEKLRDDLDAVDRTLRVFDPRQHPEKIRPVVKRKGDRMFGYGNARGPFSTRSGTHRSP